MKIAKYHEPGTDPTMRLMQFGRLAVADMRRPHGAVPQPFD
jgi:hypothetical protein